MKCPVCTSVDLLISERQGVEIDYCPQCRGVWLDRGELDKVIERSARPGGFEEGGHHGGKHHREERESKSKKKSLLQDLFDF